MGILLQGGIAFFYNSSGPGLVPAKIETVRISLTEDSSRSSTGRTILKGKLIEVEDNRHIRCSASGSLLVIGHEDLPAFYWGEIIELDVNVDIFEDSREFPFIAFSGKNYISAGWKHPLFKGRKSLISNLNDRTQKLSPSVAALFLALYRGDSDSLDARIKEKFRTGGVPHLLALSGFHVAILILLLTGILTRFIRKGTVFLAALPVLFIYLFLVGGSPSLLRAVLLFSLATLCRFAERQMSFQTLLLLTCLIQLFFFPIQGLSLSFQLSYLALWGIITLGSRINFILEPFFPPFILMPLGASLGAHIATAPLLIFCFGELYPMGIVASLAVSPLIILFMWISVVAFISLFDFLDRICLELYRLIVKTVDFFAACPSLSFSGPLTVAFYLTLLLLSVLLLYGRGTRTQFKLRFTNRDQGITGTDGPGAEKEVEPEFSD